MQYRRARVKGGTYFFTVITFKRKKILTVPENVALFRESLRYVKNRHPFSIEAIVLLPDHLHCIWTLPEGDSDFSTKWRLIKGHFSRKCKDKYKHSQSITRIRKKEQAVWQRRFWEHLIRNEEDLLNHLDYIHYNPVKHGLAEAPKDWAYSSFHHFVREGKYTQMWGAGNEVVFDENIGNE
jgi:putative transposase